MNCGRVQWQEAGNKKRFQYCTVSSREILYLRALQGHSGRNPIDPSLHDILSRRMCNQFTFHHQFGIDTGGQILSKRQTVFFTSVDPTDKNHKDLDTIDLSKPRHA